MVGVFCVHAAGLLSGMREKRARRRRHEESTREEIEANKRMNEPVETDGDEGHKRRSR